MRSPRTFRRGGLVLPSRREPDPIETLRNAFLPSLARVLLRQGECVATPIVRVGGHVQEGMVIGRGEADSSIVVHAPIPGIVQAIERVRLPAGGECESISILLEGSFQRLGKRPERYLWNNMRVADIVQTIRDKGVIESEGAGRPLHRLLDTGGSRYTSIVVNGIESEPYLRSETAVLLSRTEACIEGLRILMRATGAKTAIIATEYADRDITARVTSASGGIPATEGKAEVAALRPRFPQDLPNQLMEALSDRGRDKGMGELPLVLRPSTVLAVYEAVVEAKPFLERFITVAGGAVRSPAVLKARIGTLVGDLIEECGGFRLTPECILVGGPFRGLPIRTLDMPITKTSSAILALLPEETRRATSLPCIRCGACAAACPEGLRPDELFRRLNAGRIGEARLFGLDRCSTCGTCGFVCPSRIDLVQIFAKQQHRESVEP